jgi:hypothetical protein
MGHREVVNEIGHALVEEVPVAAGLNDKALVPVKRGKEIAQGRALGGHSALRERVVVLKNGDLAKFLVQIDTYE